jgi:hypothetical protein
MGTPLAPSEPLFYSKLRTTESEYLAPRDKPKSGEEEEKEESYSFPPLFSAFKKTDIPGNLPNIDDELMSESTRPMDVDEDEVDEIMYDQLVEAMCA